MINTKDKIFKILSVLTGILLSILIIFQTGHFIVLINRFIEIFTIVTLFVFVFVLYILKFDFKRAKQDIKAKQIPRPSFAFLLFVVVESMLLLSFLVNKNKIDNFNSYVNFMLIVAIVILFAKVINIETFYTWYSNVLTILCISSLIFYFIIEILGHSFTNLVNLHGSNIFSNYYLLYSDYSSNEAANVFYNTPTRLQGLFWEPGAFGTIILVGLLIEIGFKKKKSILKVILYLVTLLFVNSTGALFTLPVVMLYGLITFIEEKELLPGKKQRIILYVIISLVAISGVAIVFLIFKEKFMMTATGASFFTRIYSTVYNLQVWLKNPVFGLGFKTARQVYNEISPAYITANTATPSLLMGAFGIIGVLYTLLPVLGLTFNSKISAFRMLIFIVIFFLILHQENNASLVGISIFYAYLALPSLKFKWEDNPERHKWVRESILINSVIVDKKEKKVIKKPNRKGDLIYRLIFVFSSIAFLVASFISINSVNLVSTTDELYNISTVLADRDCELYDGAIGELKGRITLKKWVSYEKAVGNRQNNKGVTFSLGETKIDKYTVSFSEISFNEGNGSRNSKNLSFIAYDGSLYDENSIVIPRKLSDKLFGIPSKYSDILGQKVTMRMNDNEYAERKVVGVYDLNSNHRTVANDIFIKNFDNTVFLPSDSVLKISSTKETKYYISLSKEYQYNYSNFYTAQDTGVKRIEYPDLEINKNFKGEISLNSYINSLKETSNNYKTLKIVLPIVAIINLVFLGYIIFNDVFSRKEKTSLILFLGCISLGGLLSLIIFNKSMVINGFTISIISNSWAWFVTISLIISIASLFLYYCYLIEESVYTKIKSLLKRRK